MFLLWSLQILQDISLARLVVSLTDVDDVAVPDPWCAIHALLVSGCVYNGHQRLRDLKGVCMHSNESCVGCERKGGDTGTFTQTHTHTRARAHASTHARTQGTCVTRCERDGRRYTTHTQIQTHTYTHTHTHTHTHRDRPRARAHARSHARTLARSHAIAGNGCSTVVRGGHAMGIHTVSYTSTPCHMPAASTHTAARHAAYQSG